MDINKKIAVIFTCFNRKEKTIKCVKSLLKQKNMPDFQLYICDDRSTDGTVDEINKIIPEAVVIEGTGSLFWSRGMYEAMKPAVEHGYEFYLMINDDVEFNDNMWQLMHEAYEANKSCGVTGSTLAKSTGKQSYGGAKFFKKRSGDYIGPMLEPKHDIFVECDVANWNCFLIDDAVIKEVGLIDNVYEHAMGDFDYSLRMRKQGFKIVQAKDYVGYCEDNDIYGTFKDSSLPRKQRIKKLFAQNGLPYKSWKRFVKKYYVHGTLKNIYVPYLKYGLAILLRKDC